MPVFLCTFLLIASCEDDSDTGEWYERDYFLPVALENYNPAEEIINTSITRYVYSESGTGIPDAIIKYRGGTTKTNEFGHFFIENKKLDAKGTVIQVFKEGYFEGNRRLFPREHSESKVRIALIPKYRRNSFSAVDGGETRIPFDGIEHKVIFPANGIVDEFGKDYAGNVSVYAAYIRPNHSSTADMMPGSLHGITSSRTEVALQSYGMLAVELQDDAGNLLNIKEGHTATIHMQIPNDLIDSAPQSIPLWSFYSPYGLWVEEGEALLSGTEYVGEVTHFSFWNCDDPFPNGLSDFSVRVLDDQGRPLPNTKVTLEARGIRNGISYGITNNSGYATGKVPRETQLRLQVDNENCWLGYFDFIGPYDSDYIEEQITVPTNWLYRITFSGHVVDCNNQPVEDCVLQISVDDSQLTFEYVNGDNFLFDKALCSKPERITIQAFRLSDRSFSDLMIITNEGEEALDLELTTCQDEIESFIDVEVNGDRIIYPVTSWELGSNDYTAIYHESIFGRTFISFKGNTVGEYGPGQNHVSIEDFGKEWQISGQGQIDTLKTASYFDQFTVTRFEVDSKIIEGEFSGKGFNFISYDFESNTTNADEVYVEGKFKLVVD